MKPIICLRSIHFLSMFFLFILAVGPPDFARSAVPGLPFTEDFSDTALADTTKTITNWDSQQEALLFAKWRTRFLPLSTTGTIVSSISSDTDSSQGGVIGDINGDGHPDLVVANNGLNRLYLGDGSATPFAAVSNGLAVGTKSADSLKVRLADINYDGLLDLLVANYNAKNRIYLNTGSSPWFSDSSSLDIGNNSRSSQDLILVDVDQDGDQDLVVANNSESNRLFINGGQAPWFSDVSSSSLNAIPMGSTSLTVGDVNSDGAPDLLIGNYNDNNVLYLNSGSSPFLQESNAQIVGSGDLNATLDLDVGDINGDGLIDLVCANDNQENRIYLNQGGAGQLFTSGYNITTDTDGSFGIAIADINNDGLLDVLSANNGINNLVLHDGRQQPFSSVTTATPLDSAGNPTMDLQPADIDHDGDFDLVTINTSSTSNLLYLNNGESSPFYGLSGSFISSDSNYSFEVAAGDVNGDGLPDLVVANLGEVNRLYLNDGSGDPFDTIGALNIGTGTDPTWDIALADINQDGQLDLIEANNGVNYLYLNTGSNPYFTDASKSNITTDNHTTLSIQAADVDQDGDLDIIAGNHSSLNRFYSNNSGVFTGSDFGDVRSTYDIDLADINHDGWLDFVEANDGNNDCLYINDKMGFPFDGATCNTIGGAATETYAITVGDLNRDGKNDVIIGTNQQKSFYFLNNGGSNPFQGVNPVAITNDSYTSSDIALGDVNGDTCPDLFVGNEGGKNYLYLNTCTANPFAGVSGQEVTVNTNQTMGVLLADMDGNGSLDTVAVNGSGSTQRNVLVQNPGSSFPLTTMNDHQLTLSGAAPRSLAYGDMDNDGDLDLVVGQTNRKNALFLNNGSSQPFNDVTGKFIGSETQKTYALAVVDVNRDGHLDVIAGNFGQTNCLYLNDGDSDPFSSSNCQTISSDTHNTVTLAVGDVKKNGYPDLVVGNEGEINRVYYNQGGATLFSTATGEDITTDADNTTAIHLLDMNHDGWLDIVAGNSGQTNKYYANGPGSPVYTASENISSDNDDTHDMAVGDIDGDGHPDVVAANSATTNKYYINDGDFSPFDSLLSATGNISNDTFSTARIKLNDFDGDGDLDVLTAEDNQLNFLYSNNNSGTPFSGVSREILYPYSDTSYAMTLADMDKDGSQDLVIASNVSGQSVHLHSRYRCSQAGAEAASLKINSGSKSVNSIILKESGILSKNSHIQFFMTNNGGTNWFSVKPDTVFTFPTTGIDVRWRLSLQTLIPNQLLSLDSLTIEHGSSSSGFNWTMFMPAIIGRQP